MSKKIILSYFCLSFISLWLVNTYINCQYIYDKYKTNNIVCSIIRVNTDSVLKVQNTIDQELSSVLAKAVDKKYSYQASKDKFCNWCYSEKINSYFNYLLLSSIKIKINSLNNILILSNCFISSCRNLDKLWFYHKAHSPPIFS